MNKWLVVHSLEAFSQNPRMIGFVGKNKLDGSVAFDEMGHPIPALAKISEIKAGDLVLYYCRGESVIKGIYEVTESCYAKELRWTESPFQFKIKPVLELEEPYDFKPLVGSLELFRDLADPRRWGTKLRGIYNALRPLTEHDYNTIKNALVASEHEVVAEEEHLELQDYRKHLQLQYQIADWGIRNGFRVYIATNDKGKIREKLPEVLDDIPKFHNEDVLGRAKRIDVLFFNKRNILTHAFEVEHTPIIYSGLLRLNDIAESYPTGKVQFIIVSDESNSDKFNDELSRPSFSLLRENNCRFVTYNEVEGEWKQIRNRRPPLF
ncbi:hypothetical protein ES708_21633 [subsurface metagenome]